MLVPCQSVNFDKTSTTSNHNKHEKSKGHAPKDTLRQIPFDTTWQVCPTANCLMSSKYKYNIAKHLKRCYEIYKKIQGHIDNKVCEVRRIAFAKKSDHDKHIRQFHAPQLQVNDDTVPDDIATGNDKLNDDLPTMVIPPRSCLELSISC